jgi:hypothetical protein
MTHQAQDDARDLAQMVSHDGEKPQGVHEELKHDSDLEGDTRSYATTAPKTSPAEIKLVRKLDWIILPTLWIMYAYLSCREAKLTV